MLSSLLLTMKFPFANIIVLVYALLKERILEKNALIIQNSAFHCCCFIMWYNLIFTTDGDDYYSLEKRLLRCREVKYSCQGSKAYRCWAAVYLRFQPYVLCHSYT